MILQVFYVSAVEELEAAEDHQAAEDNEPQFGREKEGADRADPYDQQNQSEQFDLSGSSAAGFSIEIKKRQRNHFLRFGRQ
jgi:hypothetical protein